MGGTCLRVVLQFTSCFVASLDLSYVFAHMELLHAWPPCQCQCHFPPTLAHTHTPSRAEGVSGPCVSAAARPWIATRCVHAGGSGLDHRAVLSLGWPGKAVQDVSCCWGDRKRCVSVDTTTLIFSICYTGRASACMSACKHSRPPGMWMPRLIVRSGRQTQ